MRSYSRTTRVCRQESGDFELELVPRKPRIVPRFLGHGYEISLLFFCFREQQVRVEEHFKIAKTDKTRGLPAFFSFTCFATKQNTWFTSIFLVYVLCHHSIILRKCTLGWRGCSLYIERKPFTSKTHKTAINRPVDHTGEK